MLTQTDVDRVVRSFLTKCNHHKAKVTPDIGGEMTLLASAANSDIAESLIREFNGESEYERLLAARTFISMFRFDERLHQAIKVFEESLDSESLQSHIDALTHLIGLNDIPLDLLPALQRHMAEGSMSRLGAAIVATGFDDLKVEACKIIGQLMGSNEFGGSAKFLGALTLIRLNLRVKLAWSAIDEFQSKNSDPDFLSSCIAGLQGIVPEPTNQTIDRLIQWSQEIEESTKAEAETEKFQLIELFANIETDDDRIDAFLLRQVGTGRSDHVFAATNALSRRESSIELDAQLLNVNLLGAEETRIREIGATCILRCFDTISDEIIPIVTARLEVERDLEVVELLMRICGKVGYRAFHALFKGWKNPVNLRGWIHTWTLGTLGQESYEELFRVVTENPGVESNRILALMIMGARFGSPQLMARISETISTLEKDDLHNVLLALQNSDSHAAFLVPKLQPIATSVDDPQLAELAANVIRAIGKSALAYFPPGDYQSDTPSMDLRRTIEWSSTSQAKNVLDDMPDTQLERFAAVARLIESGMSTKEATDYLKEQFKNTKGWSQQSFKRAKRDLEDYLSDKWQQHVCLLERRVSKSTRPDKLTDQGRHVLQMIERYLDSID